VLVLAASAAPQTILFCRENLEREIWDSYRVGPRPCSNNSV
jgi:hypothetical protein